MLCALPRELSLYILIELLEVCDISSLDRAFLSHKERCSLLGLLSDDRCAIRNVGTKLRTNGCTRLFIDYMVTRRLHLPSVKIHPTLCDDDLLRLASTMKNSCCKYFSIESCKEVSSLGVCRFVASCGRHIEFLNIAWSRAGDDCLHETAKGCKYLLSLQAMFCDISDGSVIDLAQSCRLLTELNLTFCVNLTDSAINQIGLTLSSLRSISLSGCKGITDAALVSLSSCHQLRSVDVSGCVLITDAGLVRLVRSTPLVDTMRINNCVDISDASMLAVVECLPSLAVLCMAGLHHVTDIGIMSIAQRYLRQLKRLEIYGCSYTETGIAEVNRLCSHLPPLWL